MLEFAGGTLATAVHEESSNIANILMARAVSNRDNIAIPVFGKTYDSLLKKISDLKNAGHEVNIKYVNLPIEKVIRRVKSRFAETGRLISPKYLESVGLKPRQNYDKLKTDKGVDAYEAWDNDVPRGASPRLIERSSQSQSENPAGLGGRRDNGRRVLQGDGKRNSNAETERPANESVADDTESRSDNQCGFSSTQSEADKLAERVDEQGAEETDNKGIDSEKEDTSVYPRTESSHEANVSKAVDVSSSTPSISQEQAEKQTQPKNTEEAYNGFLETKAPNTAKLKAARDKQRELDQKINTLMTEDNKPSTESMEAPVDTATTSTKPATTASVPTSAESQTKEPKAQTSEKTSTPTHYEADDVFRTSGLWNASAGKLMHNASLEIEADEFVRGALDSIANDHDGYYDAKQERFLFDDAASRDAFVKDATKLINKFSSHVHYSASEAKKRVTRTTEELKREIFRAFPGAKNIIDHGDRLTFTMPNGAKVEVRIHDNMTVTGKEAARARREHDIADGVTIHVNGSMYTLGRQVVIDLAKDGKAGTSYHEALHAAIELLFDDKAKTALHKKYGSEEKIADAYQRFMIAEQRGGHVPFAKLFRAIRDFFRGLVSHIAPIREKFGDAWAAQKAFEDLASGKAWGYEEKKGHSHGFSLFNRAEAAGKGIDNEETNTDNKIEEENQRIKNKNQKIFQSVQTALLKEVQKLREEGWKDSSIARALNDENSAYRKEVLKGFSGVYNQFHAKNSNKRDVVSRILGDEAFDDLMRKNPKRRNEAIEETFRVLGNLMEGVMNDARKTCIELAVRFGNGKDIAGLHSWRDIEASSREHGGGAAFTEHPQEVTKDKTQHHSISRSDNQSGFSSAEDIRYSISEEEQSMQEAEKSYLHKATDRLAKAMHLKSDKVVIDAREVDDDNFNFKDSTVKSPYRVAEKIPKFRPFFNMAIRAMSEEIKNRNDFGRKLRGALKPLNKKGREDLTQIMLSGDAEGKEYTDAELLADGTSEDVVKAYRTIRRLLNKAYHLANNARRNPVEKSARMNDAELQELRGNIFVKEILSVGKKDKNGKQLVSWREYRNYTRQYENINEEKLATLKASEGVQILDTTEVENSGGKLYNVLVREGPADIHKLTGYVPHFFHDYFVRVVNHDGSSEVVGSGRTETEAIKIGEQYAKEHELEEGQTIHISPKVFDIGTMSGGEASESTYGAILGDMDYFKVQEAVAKNNDMTLDDAKRMLDGSVRMKNRHRFFGNAMHRKGTKGFETDMEWVLSHYFNTVSRYAAMESEFKPKAISMYERMFGDFNKDHHGLAEYVKDYINDINGNPSSLEQIINKALQSTALFRKVITPVFGERAALTIGNGLANKISYLTLGLNMSSALLNFTQLMNSAAYLGNPALIVTMVAKGRHHKYTRKELRILVETGVLNDIGLDSGSGYDQARAHIRRANSIGGKINNAIDAAGNASMIFFREADAICRRGTVLAAYELARKGKAPQHKGYMMSHDEAIAYAKDVNRRANFDYSVADAANIFRRGSIVSQLALQFKKYGFKELEVMADFSPWSNKTSLAQKAMFWGMYFMLAGLLNITKAELQCSAAAIFI